jgi:hypothetical protein
MGISKDEPTLFLGQQYALKDVFSNYRTVRSRLGVGIISRYFVHLWIFSDFTGPLGMATWQHQATLGLSKRD